MLSLSVKARDKTRYPGRGWQAKDIKAPAPVRRRLAPSLRDLAIGSERMADICENARQHFAQGLPILIEGETGTGKSALVTALMEASGVDPSRMLTVDCSLFSDGDMDRQHIQAIFEQARVIDLLDDANRGATILLFENVDELPDYGQVRLRGLLQSMEQDETDLDETGLDHPGPTNALHLVTTSRKPLIDALEQGRCREDLYYLLGNSRFELPPCAREKSRSCWPAPSPRALPRLRSR